MFRVIACLWIYVLRMQFPKGNIWIPREEAGRWIWVSEYIPGQTAQIFGLMWLKFLLSRALHFFRIRIKWPQQKIALEGRAPRRTAKQYIYLRTKLGALWWKCYPDAMKCSFWLNVHIELTIGLAFIFGLGFCLPTYNIVHLYVLQKPKRLFLFVGYSKIIKYSWYISC